MGTVYRAGGFRIVIFTNDHKPAHVHVFGDGEAKINLVGPGEAPELVWAIDMTRADIRRAMSIIMEQREHLLARWSVIHG